MLARAEVHGARVDQTPRAPVSSRACSSRRDVVMAPLAPAQPGMGGMGAGQPAARRRHRRADAPSPNPNRRRRASPRRTRRPAARRHPQLQTQEPTLPQDPLAIPPGDREAHRHERRSRQATPPETAASAILRPLLRRTERQVPLPHALPALGRAQEAQAAGSTRASSAFYYNRRSPKVDADVALPALLEAPRRGHVTRRSSAPSCTRSATPTARTRRRATTTGSPPLFFEGQTGDGSGYFHIPPLLTFTQHTATTASTSSAPIFCKWKGGPACDPRTADKIDLGVAPFYFYGRDETSEYEVIPPLLHYYRYNEVGESYFNLWGPSSGATPESDASTSSPSTGTAGARTRTHHGLSRSSTTATRATPRTSSSRRSSSGRRGENGENTFATWGYARYRAGPSSTCGRRSTGSTAIRTSGSIASCSSRSSTRALAARRTTSRSSRSMATSSAGLSDDDVDHAALPLHDGHDRLGDGPLPRSSTWAATTDRRTSWSRRSSGTSPRRTRARRSCCRSSSASRTRRRDLAARAEHLLSREAGPRRTRVGVPLLPVVLVRRVADRALVERALRPRGLHARNDVEDAARLHPDYIEQVNGPCHVGCAPSS